jgi:hypothetical protein
MKIISTVYQHV